MRRGGRDPGVAVVAVVGDCGCHVVEELGREGGNVVEIEIIKLQQGTQLRPTKAVKLQLIKLQYKDGVPGSHQPLPRMWCLGYLCHTEPDPHTHTPTYTHHTPTRPPTRPHTHTPTHNHIFTSFYINHML